jgi:UDP-N-acetyl-D-glucosamine/UDP-N-acetyl-D-galactosamine dehydrogenase
MPVTTAAKAEIAVIGLGYVGLPLALALAGRYSVTGLDLDRERVAELALGYDRTGEVAADAISQSTLTIVDDPAAISGADVFIVAVPTPVDDQNKPDLELLRAACRVVGGALKKDSVVVFESTVYPGVTEGVCGPELEAASGLASGSDFFLGYSPERVNPGDREHRIERIVKVVSGQTPEISALLAEIYGSITTAGVHVAKDIQTAEAAKVIENAQRDINIAFVNEVAQILDSLDISVHDVLETAATKWNFLDFRPGLVGGHCIGVDPYYLAHLATSVGHKPEVILAGRRINDGMGTFFAGRIAGRLAALGHDGPDARVLVLGLTFKEDVPDLRNSRVADLVAGLGAHGHRVDVHDPLADREEAQQFYGIQLLADIEAAEGYDCVVAAVAHDAYRAFTTETLTRLVRPGGLVADVKGMWRTLVLPDGMHRWQL